MFRRKWVRIILALSGSLILALATLFFHGVLVDSEGMNQYINTFDHSVVMNKL